MTMEAYESVSTWRQNMPPSTSPVRGALIGELAARIVGLSPERLRIAVDGYTASGKTSFAHELAAAIRAHGRPTLRATFDDFKKPWRDARENGYDRISGDGYYRNAPDFESARSLLLGPAGPFGSGTVAHRSWHRPRLAAPRSRCGRTPPSGPVSRSRADLYRRSRSDVQG